MLYPLNGLPKLLPAETLKEKKTMQEVLTYGTAVVIEKIEDK